MKITQETIIKAQKYLKLNYSVISEKTLSFTITENLFKLMQQTNEGLYPNSFKYRLKLKDKFKGFVGFLGINGCAIYIL